MKLFTTLSLLTIFTFILWNDLVNNTVARFSEEQFGIIASETDSELWRSWWYLFIDWCKIVDWDMSDYNWDYSTDDIINYLLKKNNYCL